MNKDTVVASVIGFGLGLIAAIALWVVPKIMPKTSPSSSPALAAKTAVESARDERSDAKFTITSPKEGDIVTSDKLKLTGMSQASAVFLTTSTENIVAQVKSDGTYETTLTLTGGHNEILATQIHEGSESATRVNVFYYPEGI